MSIEFNPDKKVSDVSYSAASGSGFNYDSSYRKSPIFDKKVIGELVDKFISNAADGKISKDAELDITGDKWRELADKKGKSDVENKQMLGEYKDKMLLWADSYIEYLDNKYGDGNKRLTKEEFIDAEIKDVLEQYELNEEQLTELRASAEKMFENLNIDTNDEIGPKEIAAMFAMFDMDNTTGEMNGKIKVEDMNIMSKYLPVANDSDNVKNLIARLKAVYDMLFKAE